MAEGNTGSVVFRGDPGTLCDEAREYTEDGRAVLEPGDVLSGIPEDQVKRFLLNQDFEPKDDAAQQVNDSMTTTVRRINGTLVDSLAPGDPLYEEYVAQAVPLEAMNKAELAATASAEGIELSSNDTRPEMIEKIQAAREGAGAESFDPVVDTVDRAARPHETDGGSTGGTETGGDSN